MKAEKNNGEYITDEEYREAACKRLDGMRDIAVWTVKDIEHWRKRFGECKSHVAKVQRNSTGAYIEAWVYVQDDWVEESSTFCEESAKFFSVEGQNANSFREGISAAKEIEKLVKDIKSKGEI